MALLPIRIKDSNFKQSKATNKGGAINLYFNYVYDPEDIIEIENCFFERCSMMNSKIGGGAIYMEHSTNHFVKCKITGSTFQENRCQNKGGAIYLTTRYSIIDNCHFINNYSPYSSDIYLFSAMIYDSSVPSEEKKFSITNNEFILSSTDTLKAMILLDVYIKLDKYNFENNNIRVSGASLGSLDFAVLKYEFNSEITEHHMNHANNAITPCDKSIVIKTKPSFFELNFYEAFPKCKPSVEFSESEKFTKSNFFSDSGEFTKSPEPPAESSESEPPKPDDSPAKEPTDSPADSLDIPDSSSNEASKSEDVNIKADNGKKGRTLDIWVIVLIALAVLIIVVVIIIIIVVKRRKAEQDNEYQIEALEETGQSNEGTQNEDEFNNPLYAEKQQSNDQFDPFEKIDDDNEGE